MSEQATTHTPGPWTLQVGDDCVRIIAHPFVVAKVIGGLDGDPDIGPTTIANARLLTSAPELLEALKSTLEYWETTGFAECAADCDCIVEDVRAAIAKAEGR